MRGLRAGGGGKGRTEAGDPGADWFVKPGATPFLSGVRLFGQGARGGNVAWAFYAPGVRLGEVGGHPGDPLNGHRCPVSAPRSEIGTGRG